jgi:hypothetical protein
VELCKERSARTLETAGDKSLAYTQQPKGKQMTKRIVIRNASDIATSVKLILEIPQDGTQQVVITPKKNDRTLAQNRLSHMHYKQIGDQMGESPLETKCRCKLDFGVPILMEDEYFQMRWTPVSERLAREEQIYLMESVDVTSLMNVKQFTGYIEDYTHHHESNGIVLNHPEDLYWEAMR